MNGTIRKSSLIALALLLVFAGIGVGSLTAKLVPQAAVPGAGIAHAGTLAVQQTAPLVPAGSGFTYQGQLLNGGQPAPNGSYDFRFTLYDAPAAGIVVGGPITPTTVLTNGLFTVQLDFGVSAFQGDARYMQIEVRITGGGSFTPLNPRQPITPAPYALYAQDVAPYDNVVVVAKSGGDFTTVGAALASITDNNAANRYLIHIAPGAYTETITMKPHVDIEGSGELITKISYIGSISSFTGTVVMTSNVELRSLTVESTGGNTVAVAIAVHGTSPSLLHVTAIASGANFQNYGIHNTGTSSLKMTDVTAIATGTGTNDNYGVGNLNATSTLITGVTATASGGERNYGVLNINSSPMMSGVTATASGGSLANTGVENQTNSAPIMINVTATGSGGSFSYGVHNNGPGTSAKMTGVIATASGASGTNIGVSNGGGSSTAPEMTNVTATGSGAGTSTNYGVSNFDVSPRMKGVIATASGGNNARGVYNAFTTTQIQESAISASGAISNTGVYNVANSGSYTVTIDNSTITGSTNAVRNDSNATTRIGASQLAGGAVLPNGGTMECADVHDENNTLLPYNCLNHSANVVEVAKSGVAFTSIQAALNSIADNSATNRYVVRVGPGVYTETVTMKQFVDIEGSGEGNTTISQVGSAITSTGTLVGASNAELRSLTVRNTGGNTYAIAIYNSGVGSTTQYLHVTASASGGTTDSYGVYNVSSSPSMSNVTASVSGGSSFNIGVYNVSSSPSMSNVTASVSGGDNNFGVFNNSSSPTIENGSISGSGGTDSYGVWNTAASGSYTVTIDNSTLTGSTNTIRNDTEFTTRVGASRLDGGAVTGGGTVTCADVHDENNALLPHNCVNHSANVVEVAKTGVAFTSIQAALNSITDNSATNRYVVRVGPGTYTETVQMKQYVDIEGSGELNTKITFMGSAAANTGTVRGASNAELRSLTVQNTGGNNNAAAIYNSGASPSLLHVTAIASGALTESYGVLNLASSAPTMTHVTASASGGFNTYGVRNSSSSPVMSNVTATGSGGTGVNTGVFNSGSAIMSNVKATASGAGTDNYGVYNTGSSPQMTDVIATASGAVENYGVYNTNSAPMMRGITASASGGSETFGVYNAASSPAMTVISATGTNGSFTNHGVYNYLDSSPTMSHMTVLASGGITTANYAVFNANTSITMTHVLAIATGASGSANYGVFNSLSSSRIESSTLIGRGGSGPGSGNYGVYNAANSGSHLVRIDNSTIEGSTNTILNDAEFTVRVGSSKLDGGAVSVGGGTVTCAGVHSETYVFATGPACP